MLEFRYSTRSSDHRNELPDAPSLERSKAELPHGHVKALRGSSISSVPSLRSFDELPASQLDAVLGGTLQSGEIGYSASFDGFAINRQQLLNALAVAQAKASKSLFGSDPLLLSTTTFNARIDHKFGQRDSFSTRFRHDDLIAGGARPANGAALPAITPNTKIRQSSASVSNSLDLTPNTINQTRAQFTVADAQLPAGTRLASIGLGIPGTQHDRVFEAATNIYRQVGGNSLKFGGDFLMNQASLAFVEKAGRSSISRSSRDTGLYVVSQRRMSPGLLLTSGLRYDIAPVAGLKRDRNSLAPQVGFAWSPASHTVIRGGGGMYYDQLPLFAIVGSDIQGTAANLLNSVSVSGKLPPSIGISAFNPSLQRTYVETANFGIEQHIGARTSISADYQFARGLQMMIPLQGLTSLCSSETECRAGSSFYATQTGSGAESSYHGISVAVAQEPTRWSSYTVSYSDATADSARLLSDVSYFGERVRRVGFTSVLHTSAEPASDLWQRFARGVAL
ncbi:MAG TPA: TonB-dependent receptor, partial [Edaphobacter sp.]|nr:TonB-dependent receptor [Edaphobacter sp.]